MFGEVLDTLNNLVSKPAYEGQCGIAAGGQGVRRVSGMSIGKMRSAGVPSGSVTFRTQSVRHGQPGNRHSDAAEPTKTVAVVK
jgi:hypothetical protein